MKKQGSKAKRAWILVDVGNSAFATTILAAVFPIYFPNLLPEGGLTFSILGLTWTSPAMSVWAYTVSGSLFLALLLSPIMGAWADQRGRRKFFLGGFTAVGSVAALGLGIFDTWQWVLPSFALSYICFACSGVFYNSLLPTVAEEDDRDRMSLFGYAWGYFGGGVLLALNLLLILKHDWFGLESKAIGTRLSFVSVGLWWMAFTIPSLLQIHERPRPHLDSDVGERAWQKLRQLWVTAKDLPRYPALLLFILAYAMFNDGIATVISMASIFGREAVGLNEGTLIGTLLMIQLLGLPFTVGMSLLAKKFGAKRTLMLSLSFWLVIIGFAYNMEEAIHFWILGLMVATVLGVSQALPRSMFSQLIPENRHAEFYAVYAFSGKVTAVMGPFVFGLIQDLTGNPRLAILSLGAFFLIGMVLLSFVRFPPKSAIS